MKKLFLSVLIIASAVTYTSAQSVGASPEASKWSLALKGGLTYYRVTPNGSGYLNDMSWGAGAILERTANPLWGWGLDVSYLNFNRSTITGKTIDPTLFGSINLSNLLFPHRTNSIFNAYTKFGAGPAFFNNNLNNAVNNGKDVAVVFTAALHPEISLGKAVALGVELGYRYYSKEILGGLTSKDRGDDALNALATLRFKLGADHVRNMTMDEFYPALPPVIKQVENPYDDSALKNRLDNSDKRLSDIESRLANLEQGVKDLANRPTGSSASMSFQNIEFKFDSSELTEASYPTLDQIASILKENQTWSTLKVKGHTDSVGPEAYNQGLSERRAQAVKDYLASKGVSSSVVTIEGYGETQPIADNKTAEGRQQNRRVEFEVIK